MAHAHLFRYSCEAFPLPSLSPPLPLPLASPPSPAASGTSQDEAVAGSTRAGVPKTVCEPAGGHEAPHVPQHHWPGVQQVHTSVVMTATVAAYAPHHVHAAPNTHCRACQDNPGPLPSSELNWTDPGEGSD